MYNHFLLPFLHFFLFFWFLVGENIKQVRTFHLLFLLVSCTKVKSRAVRNIFSKTSTRKEEHSFVPGIVWLSIRKWQMITSHLQKFLSFFQRSFLKSFLFFPLHASRGNCGLTSKREQCSQSNYLAKTTVQTGRSKKWKNLMFLF